MSKQQQQEVGDEQEVWISMGTWGIDEGEACISTCT
jgi:hypothetical protein